MVARHIKTSGIARRALRSGSVAPLLRLRGERATDRSKKQRGNRSQQFTESTLHPP